MIEGTFFTLQETATALHKHRNTIARWIRDGRVKAERVGTFVLISEEELNKLLGEELS